MGKSCPVPTAVRSKVVVLLLFIKCLSLLPLVLSRCFIFQYFVSILVLQSARWGRESWLFYVYSDLNVKSLLSFLTPSCVAMSWSLVCDCDISLSYLCLLTF